jgi:hypothetical protein
MLTPWRSTFCSLGFGIYWVRQRCTNGCSPRASSGLLKIIRLKVFISSFLETIFIFISCFRNQHCLIFVSCSRNQHFIVSSCFIHQHSIFLELMIYWVQGAPNACSPRALNGLLKIIHSKVFISCFLEIILLSSSNALEFGIISPALCFRNRHTVLSLRSTTWSTHVLLGFEIYLICDRLDIR